MTEALLADPQFDVLLKRGEAVIEAYGENFDFYLNSLLSDMDKAIMGGDWTAAEGTAYRLKCSAGTMGWPLVSQAANLMLHAAREHKKIPRVEGLMRVHMDTIRLMVREDMRGENPAAVILVKELYDMLSAFNIDVHS